jgi:hypothetical protein
MKKLYVTIMLSLLAPLFAIGQLSGDKIVPSTNYPTMQAVIDSLNAQGVAASGVRFLVSGGQTFTQTTLTLTASGTENGRIEIAWNGQGEKPIINFTATAAASEAGFVLSGADYVILDGLDIRSADGLLEYGIYITNATATNGAHYNIVKNCAITLNKENANQTEAIRVSPGIVAETLEGSTNHNKFYNNTIQNTFIGYSFDGNSSNTLLMSVGNEVGTENGGESTISDLVMCGVLLDDQHGFRLFNTTIQDLTRIGSGTTAPAAVSTMSGNPSEPLTNVFEIFNNRIESITSSFTSSYGIYLSARKSTHNIYNNIVNRVTATGGGTNSADGIMLFGTDILANIYNNMVSGIAAPASAVSGNAATRGINVRSYLRAQIYHNSVFLQFTATNAAHSSAAICVYNNTDSVDMRNNIFVNLTTFPANPTGRAAAFYKRTPALDNMVSTTNNNIYFAGTPSENNPIFYGHNATTPAIDQTLEAYKTRAASFDQGSFTENVPFMSDSDLHVQPLATTSARENASIISVPFAITTDIDGSVRSTETPDIGADEIANPYPDLATNPNPEDDAVDVPVQLASIGWKYTSSVEFVNPDAFKVYKNTTPDFTNVQPHATIQYVENQEDYVVNSMAGVSLQNFTTYYWKVVPTLNEDGKDINPNVPVWSFTTEKYPYPNPVVNMRPNSTDTVAFYVTRDGVDNYLTTVSFDFIPDNLYTLPSGFKITQWIEVNGIAEEQRNTYVDYISGQIHYEFENYQILDPSCEIYNFWKVIPTVTLENGPETPGLDSVKFFVTCIGSINHNNQNVVMTYPNPTSGMLYFSVPFETATTLHVYDMTGKIVSTVSMATGQTSIDLSVLESGMYIGRVTNNDKTYNIRFLIQK